MLDYRMKLGETKAQEDFHKNSDVSQLNMYINLKMTYLKYDNIDHM